MAVSSYSGPSQADLSPDVDTAWRFLEWWFQYCTRGLLEFGCMVPASGQLTAFRRFERDDVTMLKWIAEANSVPGASMYVRACTVDPASPVGRTRDEHVWEAPGVWADLDTEEQVLGARRVESVVRANGWTRTGMVPHERFQLWVRCAEPLGGADFIRLLNRRLWRLYGGDPAVCNPSRLMRVPGTIAWPYKLGRVCELTTFEVASDGRPLAYPVATLSTLLPREERAEGAAGAERPSSGAGNDDWGGYTPGGGHGRIDPTAGKIERIRSGAGGWHNDVVSLVASWVMRGWGNAEILLACEGLTLAGWTVADTRAEVLKAIEGARRKYARPEELPPDGGARTELIASEVPWDAMLALKPRAWIYAHFLIRGFVTILAAPGGGGKTAYGMAVALAIVLGKELLGETVRKGGKVWFYNLEDPLDELLRRLRAAVLRFGITRDQLAGRFFLDSGREEERELLVAVLVDDAVVVMPVVDLLVAEIKRRGVDVLVIDPVLRSHRVLENSNEHIDRVMWLWARVAQEANCAVWLLHHFKKGGAPGEAASFRGATAMVDAARAAISLSRMTKEEADDLGVQEQERWRYLRVDNAKLNLAPPPSEAAWFKLIGIDLGNQTEDQEADNIQTVEPWKPVSAWYGMPWPLVIDILEAIDAGPGDGEYYAQAHQAGDRWAGSVIIEMGGKTSAQATKILKAWCDTDSVLKLSEYYSKQRKRTVSCLRVDNDRLQKMRRDATTKPSYQDD